MRIDKLKVRPKKDLAAAPCAAEFAAMLACWASANDLSNTGACAQSGQALQTCLKTRVRAGCGARRADRCVRMRWCGAHRPCRVPLYFNHTQGPRKAPHQSTINYHLARFSKKV